MSPEDRATIRGALDLLRDKIEGHDYGRAFTWDEASRLRREALAKVESARAAIRGAA